MKKGIIILILLIQLQTKAQELFVMTEPASNMPTGSIGVRTMNSFMFDKNNKLNYHLMPEIMWGINQKWMVHLQSFQSNRATGGLNLEGGSFYAKYRFYSNDDIHKHFRLATYGRFSINRADIHQEELETMGHNSGGELGIIATQLVSKLAISASISYENVTDNTSANKFPKSQSKDATNYTLSFGRLMYPRVYKNFKQTNINLMVEFLGQTLNQNSKSNLDIVPSIQFIIRSRARIDLAYRKELYSNMLRTAPNGFLIKFEYTFFNVTK
ncbi:MAG: hypothetical protein Q7W45_00845 [Bacteroidota bacterium]|nr:hypothetical protein [Bacteroidota bacterium]MDP3146645.1 hypothetical protein [Bacteroidota bacterium]